MVQNVTVNDFHGIWSNERDIQLIDVRELSEYESQRISNSTLIPLSSFDQSFHKVDKNRNAYFLCGAGKRATKAAEYLEALGYKKLYVIGGGLKAWIENGYPIEAG